MSQDSSDSKHECGTFIGYFYNKKYKFETYVTWPKTHIYNSGVKKALESFSFSNLLPQHPMAVGSLQSTY